MKFNLGNISLYILCILAFAPIAVPLASVESKSVDIVFADLFFLVLFIALALSKNIFICERLVLYSSLAFVSYSLLLGLAGSIVQSSVINVISAVKFLKPWLIFVVFTLAGRNFDIFYGTTLIKAVSRASAVCILILVYSQIYIVQSVLPRWGSNFMGFETYGFPNTTGQYLGIVVSLLIFGFFVDSRLRLLYVFCLFLALATAIMTLSRSGAFVSILAVLVFLLVRVPKRSFLFFLSLTVILIVVALVGTPLSIDDSVADIFGKIQNRIDRLSSDDPLSGRSLIWSIALNHVNENIFFGAMFSPFSSISDHHQSAHNQYVEVLYKTGVLGLLIFLVALGLIFHRLVINSFRGKYPLDLLATAALVSMLAVSIGNLTQPNYTDSLVGGLAFALAGLSIGVRNRYAC